MNKTIIIQIFIITTLLATDIDSLRKHYEAMPEPKIRLIKEGEDTSKLKGVAGIGYEGGNTKGKKLIISEPKALDRKLIKGVRSRVSIMKTVMENLSAIRYAYNKRLRDKPDLKGRFVVMYSIAGTGDVISTDLIYSSLGDEILEDIILKKIKRWKFEEIDKLDDTTEIVYPFVFSR